MQDEQVLEGRKQSSEVAPAGVFEKVENGVKVKSGGNGIGEGYLHVGKVTQNSYIEVTISEQTNTTYTANAIVKLKNPGTTGKNHGIFIANKTNGALSAEVIVEGVSKKRVEISNEGVKAPI